MMNEIRIILFEYIIWIIFLPAGLAIKNYRKYTLELKTISYYLILATVTQVISFVFWKLKKNNLPILHVYTVLEYLILLKFYSVLLKEFIPVFVFLCLAFLFPLFAITDSIFLENIFSFNTYSCSLEALIFVFLSITWFVKIVTENENFQRTNIAIKYINSGLLIYFSGSVVLFALRNSISQLAISFRINVWTIHTLLAVQLYLLIALGLWKVKTK